MSKDQVLNIVTTNSNVNTPIVLKADAYDKHLKQCNKIGSFPVPYTMAKTKDNSKRTATSIDAIRWAFKLSGNAEFARKVNENTVRNVMGLINPDKKGWEKLSKGTITTPKGTFATVYLTFYQVETPYQIEGRDEINEAGQILSMGNNYARGKNAWGDALEALADMFGDADDEEIVIARD